MKKILFIFLFITIAFSLKSQSAYALKTNLQRVNTEGTVPPQPRYNFYSDKLNFFLSSNGWKDDAIVSIKEMKIMPPNDPSDWYYFVAVKTKRCSTPFILTYDIGDSNFGEIFIIETAGFPVDFQNYINKKTQDQQKSASDLEVLQEIYGEEAIKVFNEQVIPVLVPYEKMIYTKVLKNIYKKFDAVLEGYVPKDSTGVSYETKKESLLESFRAGNIYIYYLLSHIEDPENGIAYYKNDFVKSYVVDRANGVNNFISSRKKSVDESIDSIYKSVDSYFIDPIKKEMWYRVLHFQE